MKEKKKKRKKEKKKNKVILDTEFQRYIRLLES